MFVRMFGKSLQERGNNLENYLYYSDPFFAYNNSLYIERTINGKPVNIKLSNFLARIACLTHLSNMRKKNIIKMKNYKELKIYETIKLLYLHPCFNINAG